MSRNVRSRAGVRQNAHSVRAVDGSVSHAGPQPDAQLPAAGCALSGSANTVLPAHAFTNNPPASQAPTAATVFATANPVPSVPAVIRNMAGSISGEASQNAITADSGAPTASRAEMNGITSQEQNGAKPPTSAPSTIIRDSRPVNARLSSASAPVARSQATASTAPAMNMPVRRMAPTAKRTAGTTCTGSRIASSSGINPIASHALSARRHNRRRFSARGDPCAAEDAGAGVVPQQPDSALASGSAMPVSPT